MTPARTVQPRRPSRRWAGWLLLSLYLGAISPCGAVFTALADTFDRSHQVELCCSAEGVRVVLHHDQGCTKHHHGLMARALTTFAPPVNAAQPDHVLQFHAAGNMLKPSGATELKSPAFQNGHSVLAATGCLAVLLGDKAVQRLTSHPPPDSGGPLASLRSCVLII